VYIHLHRKEVQADRAANCPKTRESQMSRKKMQTHPTTKKGNSPAPYRPTPARWDDFVALLQDIPDDVRQGALNCVEDLLDKWLNDGGSQMLPDFEPTKVALFVKEGCRKLDESQAAGYTAAWRMMLLFSGLRLDDAAAHLHRLRHEVAAFNESVGVGAEKAGRGRSGAPMHRGRKPSSRVTH
jgi:hypothetical protein